MNRDQTHEKKLSKFNKKNGRLPDKGLEETLQLKFAGMTRTQFVNWLKSFSTEERYLILKVICPELTKNLRLLNSKLGQNWKIQVEGKKPPTKFLKNFASSLQAFIDGLVLISSDSYLDSIGFDFSFVGCPEKIFDTFAILINGWNKLRNKKKTMNIQQNIKFLTFEKEQWVQDLLQIIQQDYLQKSKTQWDPIILQKQKNQKKQFGNLWKNLSKSQKLNFLLLQHPDFQSLLSNFAEEGISIKKQAIQIQINQLLMLDKKQICNKVFKCKAKKCSLQVCSYYEMIYKNWREYAQRRKLQSRTQNKHKNKLVMQEPTKRQKSIDTSSNETNETELKSSKISVSQLDALKQIEQDIIECTDLISENANLCHERRVLAFQRIAAIFRIYGVSCRLFGSCASGIAIKDSDIDIAINQSILKYFQNQDEKKSQMSFAFQFMGEIFESLPWVSNMKVIKTASIPIIKLTVNTEVEVNQQYFTEQYRQILNRKIENGGEVQADLTIQTTEDENSNHLGVVSTNQINRWLQEIPTLRPIVILLKYYLAKVSLNQTYLGGINTYCLVVMVVSFLYSRQISQNKNVAFVLNQLLNFYGWKFDQKKFGIDLRNKQQIFYQKKNTEQQKFADLQVKDPLNEGKIMTKNCYQFSSIKQIFRGMQANCYLQKQKKIEEQLINIKKKLSKRRTKQDSETQSGSQRQRLRNYFLQLLL